mgnify:FL=1
MTTFTALAPYAVFRDTTRASIRPTATVARADREFEDLRRDAPDLGVNGVHPTAVKALIGVYGVLLLTFWAFFGGPETALTLGIITVLGVMFFGLLGGGILLSDSIPKGERGRDFGEFLNGHVSIATGWISGREAFAQIIVLPLALLAGAVVFGAIWRLTAG